MRGHLRRIWIERNPVTVTPSDVRASLSDGPSSGLERAAEALPSVGRWIAELDTLGDAERRALVARADAILAHRFDLLGSGPVNLGPVIDWQRDFKAGRSWPLDHISRIVVSYPDNSDIKIPWELSRFQHLPVLAAAHRVTGDRRYLDEIGAQIEHWCAANPIEFGANWACTMDVAIRSVNWIATLVICREDVLEASWLESCLGSLLLHARFIRSHLELGDARGNHYLSDVVGLLVVSALFAAAPEGRSWAGWATDELLAETRHQIRADGCDHEASIPYHRLVAELLIVGADAADAIVPGRLDPEVRAAIGRMLAFTAAYLRPGGLAPQIGDADDGRLLPLDDYGARDHRDHRHLFYQAGVAWTPSPGSAAFDDGGFYVMRTGRLHAVVRCGDVGIHGRGCHSHNDQLSFDLAWGDEVLVTDPGTYLYTADPAERNRFRGTGFHSTLVIDGAEQNELRVDRLFAMVDRSRAEMLTWDAGAAVTTFVGRHHGYCALAAPAMHTRRLELGSAGLTIADAVESAAEHDLCWTLPLGSSEVVLSAEGARARFKSVELVVSAPGLDVVIVDGWRSPSYGCRVPSQFLRLNGRSHPGTHIQTICLAVQALE